MMTNVIYTINSSHDKSSFNYCHIHIILHEI
jgi:hypothetical protein